MKEFLKFILFLLVATVLLVSVPAWAVYQLLTATCPDHPLLYFNGMALIIVYVIVVISLGSALFD